MSNAATHNQELYTVQQAARLLGWGSTKFFARLRELNILDSGNVPYPRYVQAGYFKIERRSYWHLGQQKYIQYARALLTCSGLDWVAGRLDVPQQTGETPCESRLL